MKIRHLSAIVLTIMSRAKWKLFVMALAALKLPILPNMSLKAKGLVPG